MLVHTVVATIGTLCGAETLDRLPETTAQAACADRLLFTKTDLAMPSPMLRQRLEALNPAASMSLIAVDTVLGVKHQISLFRSDRGCRRAHCGQGQGAQSRAGLRPSLTSAAHAGLGMSDRDGGMISSQSNNGIGII